MVGENAFYEKAGDRDDRFQLLVRQVAIADPQWTGDFLGWLRGEGSMRSASLVAALEAARAMVEAKLSGSRQIVASVLQPADEPGEALAYWTPATGAPSRNRSSAASPTLSPGSTPSAACSSTTPRARVSGSPMYSTSYTRRLRTTSQGRGGCSRSRLIVGTAARPAPRRTTGSACTCWPRTSGCAKAPPRSAALLDPEALSEAGMTWEDVLSLAGSQLHKAELWQALIPSMGYMAPRRNLRNFDQAGGSAKAAASVAARLADPSQVSTSRKFPFRFLAAYRAALSLRWGHALEQALTASLGNVPELPGARSSWSTCREACTTSRRRGRD